MEDGKKISFCLDDWLGIGPLRKYLCYMGPLDKDKEEMKVDNLGLDDWLGTFSIVMYLMMNLFNTFALSLLLALLVWRTSLLENSRIMVKFRTIDAFAHATDNELDKMVPDSWSWILEVKNYPEHPILYLACDPL